MTRELSTTVTNKLVTVSAYHSYFEEMRPVATYYADQNDDGTLDLFDEDGVKVADDLAAEAMAPAAEAAYAAYAEAYADSYTG